MVLLVVSFIAGILTVLAPCTIALLPVIVGGTLAGGRSIRRAITVTASLGVSVILFTLLLKVSTTFINVPQLFWEILSGVIIVLIGLTMLFPSLWDRLTFLAKFNISSNRVLTKGYLAQDFWGDVLVGAALGPVFSSCSPTYFLIIATILPKSVVAGAFDLIAYAIGLCGMLLVVAVAGQKLMERFNVASDPRSWWRRAIGILFILIGVAIATGWEQQFELAFANSNFNFSGIEQDLLSHTSGSGSGTQPTNGMPAPDITGAAGYINTNGQPITISQFKGKDVVLIDFWDYSCINCQREIPYVEAWYQKYQNEGLVVIGVHTPEFAFEKLLSNVQAAVTAAGITYPVVLDNNYATWNAFNNEYWPQTYLINIDGDIVYSHSGEGDYPETEAAIQSALMQRDQELGATTTVSTGTVNPSGAVQVNDEELGSPETYFGSDRNEYLANGEQGMQGSQTLTLPASSPSATNAQGLQLNALYLGGTWNFMPQYAEANAGATIEYQFDAKNVYMVATGNPSAQVQVLLDGQPIGTSAGNTGDAGADVSADGTMTVSADRLYKVIALPAYGTHTLQLKIISGTLDAYTFTFG